MLWAWPVHQNKLQLLNITPPSLFGSISTVHKDDSDTEASAGLIKYPRVAFRKPRDELSQLEVRARDVHPGLLRRERAAGARAPPSPGRQSYEFLGGRARFI